MGRACVTPGLAPPCTRGPYAREKTGYVFTTRTGRPIEPRNVYRSFTRATEDALDRVARLHDVRHGTATLLTTAGVPPRVVMEIPGHAQIAVTMNKCAHLFQDAQRADIRHVNRMLHRRPPTGRATAVTWNFEGPQP